MPNNIWVKDHFVQKLSPEQHRQTHTHMADRLHHLDRLAWSVKIIRSFKKNFRML